MNKKLLCNVLIYGALGLIVVSWLPVIFGVTPDYRLLVVWAIILKLVAIMGYLWKKSMRSSGGCCIGMPQESDKER